MFICLLVGGVEGRGWKVYSRQSRFVVIYNFPKNRFVYRGGNTKFTRDGCFADVRLVGAGESRGEKKKNVCHLVVVVIVVCGGVRWAWGWGNYDSDQHHITS